MNLSPRSRHRQCGRRFRKQPQRSFLSLIFSDFDQMKRRKHRLWELRAEMFRFAVLLLLVTSLTVHTEKHSLTYIYSAFSKPINLPGIHDFTAMGLLDNKTIDYYDSTLKRKIPKQDWMAERLAADYWRKGTQSCQSKQQWLKEKIKILMNQMRQNDTDVHTLQQMHGCVGDVQPDGSLTFYSGMDEYRYDGNDFLSFDVTNGVWVAHVPAAEQTKREWNSNQVLREYTKGYLKIECMEWLRKFVYYGQLQLRMAEPPTVHVFAKKGKTRRNVELTCLASGFYPKEIDMVIRRNGRVMTKDDGLESTGSVPNHDDTSQRRNRIQILREDLVTYTCEVIHKASYIHITKTWDKVLPTPEEDGSGNMGAIVGGAIVGLILVVGVLFVLVKKGKIGRRDQNDNPDSATVQINMTNMTNITSDANSRKSSTVSTSLLKNGSLYGSDSGVSSTWEKNGESSESQSLMSADKRPDFSDSRDNISSSSTEGKPFIKALPCGKTEKSEHHIVTIAQPFGEQPAPTTESDKSADERPDLSDSQDNTSSSSTEGKLLKKDESDRSSGVSSAGEKKGESPESQSLTGSRDGLN